MTRSVPTREMINATVGSRIKRLREEMGISQRELCRLAGLSPTALNTIEKGTGAIGSGNLLAVAEALDTTPDWFYGELITNMKHNGQHNR